MLCKRFLSSIALVHSVAATGLRDTIAQNAELSLFKDLVDQYDVWQPFASMENITVLAPNNAAYEVLLQIGLNLSEMGADFTVPILKYHFLEGMYDSDSFAVGDHAKLVDTALTGLNQSGSAPVKLSRAGDDRLVESGLQTTASVVESDISFDGGLLHVLNFTLVAPHNISATAFMNQLNEFLEVMESSNMVGTMEDLHDATIFLPRDSAWEKYKALLALMSPAQVAKVLGYHAVKGEILYQHTISEEEQTYTTIEGGSITVKTNAMGNILVNGVPVVREDLVWYGGVAHIIDDVLIPEPGRETVHHNDIEVQTMTSPTRRIVLYAKKSPVATASILSMAFVLVAFSLLGFVRQRRSKSAAATQMRLVMQERADLPEKLYI